MAMSLLEMLNIRGLLRFSGWIWTVPGVKSMSVHLILDASPLRIVVSLRSWRKTLVFCPHAVMS